MLVGGQDDNFPWGEDGAARHYRWKIGYVRATSVRNSDVTPALHGHEMALVTAAHENSAVQGALLYNAVGLEPFMDVIWTTADQPGNIANQGKLARRTNIELQAIVAALASSASATAPCGGIVNCWMDDSVVVELQAPVSCIGGGGRATPQG